MRGWGIRSPSLILETGRAAQIGDTLEISAQTLEISAQSPNPLIGVHPLRYVVTAEGCEAEPYSVGRIWSPTRYRRRTELLGLTTRTRSIPKTWIPYRLAKAMRMSRLTIYDLSGGVVRRLNVGHRIAAVYENVGHKAIYWDGRTEFGERVASGIYFYHLSAGNYSATRKMVILK